MKDIEYEIKKIEMMLVKIKNQPSICKTSVLSSSIEKDGFWWNECEIKPSIIANALQEQLFELKRKKRASQKIEKA